MKLAVIRLEEKVRKHFNDIEAADKHDKHRERIKNARTIRTYNFKTRQAIDHRSKRKADLRRVLDGEIELMREK